MTRLALSVAAMAGLVASLLLWRLLDAHQALGQARLAARLNANAVAILQDQEQRNERLDRRLEQLAVAHDSATREILRDVYAQPAGDACRRSPAMRALDGRLRHGAGDGGDRAAAAAAPAQSLPRPEDRPDEGDDRALAAWEAETWHRGHACADRLDAWIAWWRERAALTPSKPDHP